MTVFMTTNDVGSSIKIHVPKGAAVFPSIYIPATFPKDENPKYRLSVVWDHPDFISGPLQQPSRPYIHFSNTHRPPVNIQGESVQWLVAELAGYDALNIPKDRIFESHALDLMVQKYEWTWVYSSTFREKERRYGVGYKLLDVTLMVDGPWL